MAHTTLPQAGGSLGVVGRQANQIGDLARAGTSNACDRRWASGPADIQTGDRAGCDWNHIYFAPGEVVRRDYRSNIPLVHWDCEWPVVDDSRRRLRMNSAFRGRKFVKSSGGRPYYDRQNYDQSKQKG